MLVSFSDASSSNTEHISVGNMQHIAWLLLRSRNDRSFVRARLSRPADQTWSISNHTFPLVSFATGPVQLMGLDSPWFLRLRRCLVWAHFETSGLSPQFIYQFALRCLYSKSFKFQTFFACNSKETEQHRVGSTRQVEA